MLVPLRKSNSPDWRRGDDVAQLGVGERPVADEIDGLDLGGAALVDLEHEIHAIAVELDDLGLDRGREAALAAVDVEDALHVGLRPGAREHGARLELDLALERILVDLLLPSKATWLMTGFSTTVMTHAAALAVDAHVGEQAGGEQRPDRLVDLARIVGVADVEFEIGANGLGLHAPVADHADFANGAALRLRRQRRTAAPAQRRPAQTAPDRQGQDGVASPPTCTSQIIGILPVCLSVRRSLSCTLPVGVRWALYRTSHPTHAWRS